MSDEDKIVSFDFGGAGPLRDFTEGEEIILRLCALEATTAAILTHLVNDRFPGGGPERDAHFELLKREITRFAGREIAERQAEPGTR